MSDTPSVTKIANTCASLHIFTNLHAAVDDNHFRTCGAEAGLASFLFILKLLVGGSTVAENAVLYHLQLLLTFRLKEFKFEKNG